MSAQEIQALAVVALDLVETGVRLMRITQGDEPLTEEVLLEIIKGQNALQESLKETNDLLLK